MDSYGLNCLGKVVIQKVTSLPTWTASDEARILYLTTTQEFYIAGNSDWQLVTTSLNSYSKTESDLRYVRLTSDQTISGRKYFSYNSCSPIDAYTCSIFPAIRAINCCTQAIEAVSYGDSNAIYARADNASAVAISAVSCLGEAIRVYSQRCNALFACSCCGSAIWAVTNAPATFGIAGIIGGATGSGMGILGYSNSGTGIQGQSNSGTGVSGNNCGPNTSFVSGVNGFSINNFGIIGSSTNFPGIWATSVNNTGLWALTCTGHGIIGETCSPTGLPAILGRQCCSGAGVCGISYNGCGVAGFTWGGGAAVAGNTAYQNFSSRHIKHLSDICITECLKNKPLKIYKYTYDDSNTFGFTEYIGPTAEDFHKTFDLEHENTGDDYLGLAGVDTVALGLSIENMDKIESLKMILKNILNRLEILEGKQNGSERKLTKK